jgi:hypothetical protein
MKNQADGCFQWEENLGRLPTSEIRNKSSRIAKDFYLEKKYIDLVDIWVSSYITD